MNESRCEIWVGESTYRLPGQCHKKAIYEIKYKKTDGVRVVKVCCNHKNILARKGRLMLAPQRNPLGSKVPTCPSNA